jgi:SanA protein
MSDMKTIIRLLRNRWFVTLAGILCLSIVAVFAVSTTAIARNQQYVLHDEAAMKAQHAKVGLVLGALVSDDGKPYPNLRSRLDVAADALKAGYVDKLIVSGDNRFVDYNEPSAMKRYLVQEHGIDAEKIQPDFAGRSTYESCERLAKVFKVKETIIYSAGSHLPRAIYLCRHFGVEAYGVAGALESNNAGRREPLAAVKAIFNVYVRGEKTILGEPIAVQ